MDHGKLIDELERDEKFMPKPYFDCGHPPVLSCLRCGKGALTVGIGRNLRDKGLRKGEAYHLTHNDIEEVEADLDARVPWWRRLDEVRQRVLANMCFNMGVVRLMEFEHMLAHAMIGQYGAAADAMVASAWYVQVGARAVRLVQMMRTGEEPVKEVA